MKSPISFLLLLATATTGAAGYHAVRRASSINNSTDDVDVNVNNGCPLCTCDAAPSTTSDDNIIEASILMLDVQVSLIIVSYYSYHSTVFSSRILISFTFTLSQMPGHHRHGTVERSRL